jgi:hypothetical protein
MPTFACLLQYDSDFSLLFAFCNLIDIIRKSPRQREAQVGGKGHLQSQQHEIFQKPLAPPLFLCLF